MAKKFFYVCAGLLLLAVCYHLGASGAQAQAGSTVSGFSVTDQGDVYVLTPNGDVYHRTPNASGWAQSPPAYVGNFWNLATASVPQTWGQVKSTYRK